MSDAALTQLLSDAIAKADAKGNMVSNVPRVTLDDATT